ncbi:MAG: flavin reductase family protein, partial [Streptosporangiaceae bacterium]
AGCAGGGCRAGAAAPGRGPPRFAASGRPGARLLLDDVPHHRGTASGALIVDEGLAAMECEVTSRVPAGDHTLVIGRVLMVDRVAVSGQPLIRFHRQYASLAGD